MHNTFGFTFWHVLLFLFVSLTVLPARAAAADFAWGNERVSFRFDPSAGYGLVGVCDKVTSREILAADRQAPDAPNFWELFLVDGRQQKIRITNRDCAVSEHFAAQNATAAELTITWRGSRQGALPDAIEEVTVRGRLPAGSAVAEWRISATARPPYHIWSVDFPAVSGIRDLGDDYAIFPEIMGRLVRNPAKRLRDNVRSYPGSCSMQFVAAWGSEKLSLPPLPQDKFQVQGWVRGPAPDETGIYLAALDGNYNYKELSALRDPKRESYGWRITSYPALPAWPLSDAAKPVTYAVPYPFALGVFEGGAETACGLYRQWALQQPWAARGPIWKPEPQALFPLSARVKNNVFWSQNYCTPGKVVPEVTQYRSYLRVPEILHYYFFSISGFNENEPEPFPASPYLAQGVRDMKNAGIGVMPYICCATWDPDTQSWRKRQAAAGAALAVDGKPYTWLFPGNSLTQWMDPSAPVWQQKQVEEAGKFMEYGMNGIYLDCLGQSSKLSYNRQLHPVHGGNYWGAGNRQLLGAVQTEMRKCNPAAFLATEGICDAYLDRVDAFLTLDVSRYSWHDQNGWDAFPLFAMVYHDYAINFGGECAPQQEPDFFAWQLGLCLTWGSQLQYIDFWPPPKPEDFPVNSAYLAEAARAYHQVARKFLTGGRWIQTAQVPQGELAGNAPVAVIGPEHTVRFSFNTNPSFLWVGPAVLASAWKADDGTLGVILTNITASEKRVQLRLDVTALGLPKAPLWNLWPLPVAPQPARGESPRVLDLVLPPHSVRVVQAGGSTPPEPEPLEEIPWRLCTADSKGEFAPLTMAGQTLWGCEDSVVRNEMGKENRLTLSAKTPNGLARRRLAKVVNWTKSPEGCTYPRASQDKPFFLLRPTPYQLMGAATAEVEADKSVLVATIDATAACQLVAPADAVLFTRDATGQVRRATGRLDLRAGRHLVAIMRPEDLIRAEMDPASPVRQAIAALSAGSDPVAAMARFSLAVLDFAEKSADRPRGAAFRDGVARLSRAAAATTRVATGVDGALVMPQDWLAPGLPLLFTACLQVDSAAAVRLAGMDFVPLAAANHLSVTCMPPARTAELTPLIPLKTAFRLDVSDDSGVEHLLPFQVQAVIASNGMKFGLPISGQVTVDRPLFFKAQLEGADAVPGRPCRIKFEVRNVSPYAVAFRLGFELPPGWRANTQAAQPQMLTSNQSRFIEAELIPAPAETAAVREIECSLIYGVGAEMRMYQQVTVNILQPLAPAAKTVAAAPEIWGKTRSLFYGRTCFYVQGGNTLRLALSSERINPEKNDGKLTYTLRGADLTVMAQGVVDSDKTCELTVAAAQAGGYFLDVHSDPRNAWRVQPIQAAAGGFVASEAIPLKLDKATANYYAYVPVGGNSFQVSLQDEGNGAEAELEIIRPDGTRAFHDRKTWNHDVARLAVPPGTDGKIWTFRIKPVGYVEVRLSDDIVPCLSPTPDAVLKQQP